MKTATRSAQIASFEESNGRMPSVFATIYKPEINISIYQRNLSKRLIEEAREVLEAKPSLQDSQVVTPENSGSVVSDLFGSAVTAQVLVQDMSRLVDMFCGLFGLKEARLKLSAIDHAMCPRFHVDWVPCRLLTTYDGEGTQWLPHDLVDRRKLGPGSEGLPDERSGLFRSVEDIRQLNPGDVALLKGENWIDNEGSGLVHRSPQLFDGEKRLLFSLDFTNI